MTTPTLTCVDCGAAVDEHGTTCLRSHRPLCKQCPGPGFTRICLNCFDRELDEAVAQSERIAKERYRAYKIRQWNKAQARKAATDPVAQSVHIESIVDRGLEQKHFGSPARDLAATKWEEGR